MKNELFVGVLILSLIVLAIFSCILVFTGKKTPSPDLAEAQKAVQAMNKEPIVTIDLEDPPKGLVQQMLTCLIRREGCNTTIPAMYNLLQAHGGGEICLRIGLEKSCTAIRSPKKVR